MIVSFPTALYQSVLPNEPQDGGNTTFIISSTDPPRSNETFFQLLRSVELKHLPDRVYSRQERRARLGGLIFRVAEGTQRKVASGKKIFEVGQLLDFGDVTTPVDIDTLNAPKVLEIQQNTNILALQELGLTSDEVEALVSGATDKLESTVALYNDTKTSIADKEAEIADNQRLINEARKAREAATTVFAGTSNPTAGSDIITKLSEKESELSQQRSVLIDELNVLTAQANEIYNEILDLREVVR